MNFIDKLTEFLPERMRTTGLIFTAHLHQTRKPHGSTGGVVCVRRTLTHLPIFSNSVDLRFSSTSFGFGRESRWQANRFVGNFVTLATHLPQLHHGMIMHAKRIQGLRLETATNFVWKMRQTSLNLLPIPVVKITEKLAPWSEDSWNLVVQFGLISGRGRTVLILHIVSWCDLEGDQKWTWKFSNC